MTAVVAPGTKTRVLIASEHAPTRSGIRLALAGEADCVEAADPDGAVAAAREGLADVCLIGFEPPGRAIGTAAAITSAVPDAVVVVITRRLNDDEVLAAVRAGVAGYLSEAIAPDRLPYVIRGVLRGEAAIPRRLVRLMADELRGGRPRHLSLKGGARVALTAREAEVVEGLRRGLSTRELAGLLGISDVTVRRHVSALHQKVGTGTRAELARALADAAPR